MPATALLKIAKASWLAALALAVCISSVLFLERSWFSLQHPEQENYTDMDIFVAAAKHYMASGELYLRSNDYAHDYAPGAAVYKFPPAYQLTIYPLLKVGMDGFRFAFVQRILQLAMYLSAGLMMLVLMEHKFLRNENRTDGACFRCWNFRLAGSLFVIWSTGFLDAFSGIEPEILICFLLASSLYLLDNKPFASGVAIALATAIKVYPALMLLFFIAARNRKGFYGFFAGLAVITLVSILVFGLPEHLFYLQHILPVLMTEPVVYHIQNTTIETMLFLDHLIPVMNGHVTAAVKLFTTTILLFTCYKSFTGKTANTITLYSLFIAALLLCLTNYWLQYQVVLVIPVLCLLALAIREWHRVYLPAILMVMVALAIEEIPYEHYRQAIIDNLLDQNQFAIENFSVHHPDIDPVLRFAPHLWLLMRMRDLVFLAPLVLFLLLSRFNYLDQNAR